jgi:glycosyltransferase involved in cell wall biosynthesis
MASTHEEISPGLKTAYGDPVLVSVVIPAYNAAPYIGGTLNSVLAQTFTNYEILVVNDGSPDTTALESVLQPYQGSIRYIKQENRGPSGARNAGIQAARGKYVAFLDSDDVWLPQHLAQQMELFARDPSLALVYANGLHIAEDKPVGIAFDSTPQSLPVDFDALLAERATVNTSSTVVARQALVEAGMFDERFRRCEDFDLWLRLAHAGVRMTFSREIQIGHRLANGLAADSELMKQALIEVYEKAATIPGLNESQLQLIRSKIANIATAIQFERAKRFLLAGEFGQALEYVNKALARDPGWKLRCAQLSIRYLPGVVQPIYRWHLARVARRKRARREHLLRKAGLNHPLVIPKPLGEAAACR